jgi:Flp pilus assembly protein TadD
MITTTAKSETARPAVKPSPTRSVTATTKTKSTADDEDESEEVELTLTKPLKERVDILKAFLEGHPESKSRDRATELLVSAHAGLGDERLKKGDSAGGIEQLRLAIAEAPVSPSEKLFSGVISQIPLNLYLRGERAAALKAAQDIEAKFGSDPKRLVMLAGFYISTEQAAEALRLATQAVQLAPDLADAHYWLGLALHISLRLDEAAAEYKRALELDPNSKAARRSLADLNRASGKAEEALALYRQQLEAESTDKAARTGLVVSLLDLGRADEAKTELEKALQTDPRNLNLLAGVAYWFAAHNDSDSAVTYGYKAVQIEPRYTWAQVALARALVAQKKPLEAERAVRFARQYGKFPTLDYELANALAAAALYEEASETLMQSFTVKDGQIETRLGGQASARNASFIELLALERRASIFQPAAADTENNAKLLKALLTFATLINDETNGGKIDEERATAAAKEFAAGDDAARVYRQLYAASRLLQKGVGYQTAYELAEAARTSAEAGLNVPALTLAVQADEFRVIRARAIAAGGTPEIPEAPRNVLSNLLRGRVEDISGWALFNEDKLDEAVEHLKRATTILPEGTPASRTSLWHLGVALERQDKKAEALSYYIKSFNAGEADPVRRAVIEQLYRKVNGSLDGLDERIGPAASAPVSVQTAAPNSTPEKTNDTPAQKTSPDVPVTTPEPTSSAEASSASSASTATAEPSPSPQPTPTTESPVATPTPSPNATSESKTTPAPETSLGTSPVEKMDKPARATVVITGRVKDASGDPIANVVVVLISPQGTVLASTTDAQGNYSFTVAPSLSTRSYRVIPSKEGLAFEPVDKVLVVANEDQKDLNFVGAVASKP